jgi:hypothetical protein
MQTLEQQRHSIKYTIEHIGNCVLISGNVPLHAFSTISKLVDKHSVIDTHLARIAGCQFALGPKEDTQALAESLYGKAIQLAQHHYANSGLSEAAIQWLAIGEHGNSSNALFFALTHIKPGDMDGSNDAHPHDPDDLRRCRLLLAAIPEYFSVEKIAAISPVWAKLVANWDAICAMMDKEAPEWRSGIGKCPETYRLIQDCLNSDA